MNLFLVNLLRIIFIMYFTGCVNNNIENKNIIDETMPVVTNIKTISDINSIAFEWKPINSSKVKGYLIYRKLLDSSTSQFKLIAKINSKYSSHYVDLNLDVNREFVYFFRTFTSSNIESLPSENIIAKTQNTIKPVSFITTVSNMPRRVKVLWRPHTNMRVKSYIIQRENDKGNFEDIATIDGRLQVEYIDENLKDKHKYTYRVLAKSYDNIISLPSKTVSAITKKLPPVVKNLSATQTKAKAILISWSRTDYADLAYYRLYSSEEFDGNFTPMLKTNNLEFLHKVEEDGKELFYKVVAVDSDDLESPLQKNPVKGKTLIKPKTPKIEFCTIDEDSILLQWNNQDSRSVGFLVNREAKIGLFSSKYDSFKVNKTIFRDMDVKPSIKYIYTVQAIDANGILSEKSKESIMLIGGQK